MIIRNLIYILQKENYNLKRFVSFVYTHLKWYKLEKRQRIKWTSKARAIQALTWLLILFILAAVFLASLPQILAIFTLAILFLTLPFVVSLACFFLWPLDFILKRRKKLAAARILQSTKLIKIGITGSYGKTSTKEILAGILKEKFKVIKTPENINTDIGIAEFICQHKEEIKKADIFIAEMGAYRCGEIKKICALVKPDYSILVGINETHLERFGSLANIIKGKFELPLNTQKVSVLNLVDKNVRENYQKFPLKKFIGVSDQEVSGVEIKDNFAGLKFNYRGHQFETALLARHNIVLILLSLTIARLLGLEWEEIKRGVALLKPIPHRLEPIYNAQTDIMVLDDSYNGNLAGVKSGLEVLSRARGRKVVLTPGLVELGPESERIHRQIAAWYMQKADLVLLIKNKMTDYICQVFKAQGFKNYLLYASAIEAHNDLVNVLKPGDTIIFQNDLPDNY